MARPESAQNRAGFIRRNLLALSGAGIVVLAGLAWLAFGYFGVHTLFIDDEVDEAGPVFASGVAADEPAAPDDAANEDPAPEDAAADDGATDDPAAADDPGEDAPADAEPASEDDTAEPPATDEGSAPAEGGSEGEIVTLVSGTFSGLSRYSAEGTALVLNDGTEQRFLRFEDFSADNGPDLNVYLTVGGDVDAGFVDLGDLKGNIGSQNYEIPTDVDLAEFDTVVIWCVRFGVGFAEAPLA